MNKSNRNIKSVLSIGILLILISNAFAKEPIPVSPYDFPYGYPFKDYPLAGASDPSASRDYLIEEPYNRAFGVVIKRMAQYALRLIQTDRIDEAIAYTDRIMENNPRLLDEEMYFMRAMALAQKGEIDLAAESLELAISEAGQEPQRFLAGPRRFLAGPRRLFAPMHDHPVFVDLWQKYKNDLVHGPMLGALTDQSVKVWVRTVVETPVHVIVSTSPDMSDPLVSQTVMSRASEDYTAVIPVKDLKPDTRYYYSVVLKSSRGISNFKWNLYLSLENK